MPVAIKSDGTWAQEYSGPYAGIDSQTPAVLLAENASPLFNNFILRNKELRSAPKLALQSVGVSSDPIVGLASFVDTNGTYHTVYWSGTKLVQYAPSLLPAAPWAIVGTASPSNMNNNPVAYRSFANTIWYTCLSQAIGRPRPAGGGGSGGPTPIVPFLAYWNGIDAAPVYQQTFADLSVSNSVAGISLTDSPTVGGSLPGAPTVVGPLAIGGQYLGELNNQLILANVNVYDQAGGGTLYNFPNLVWWSANGLPKQWDPTQNTSAGFNAFLDVPDLITGLMTLGVAGYIFRTNGITQFSPSGSAIAPFEFDHMWASDHGIGNVVPWSIAQYGPTGVFIAEDDIYSLAVTSAKKIGGGARDAIMADLAAAPALAGPVLSNQPFACITPKFQAGYVYLTYRLYIPFTTYIREWAFSFEDNNWAPRDLPFEFDGGTFPVLYCAPNLV